jgi:hypothetical protein
MGPVYRSREQVWETDPQMGHTVLKYGVGAEIPLAEALRQGVVTWDQLTPEQASQMAAHGILPPAAEEAVDIAEQAASTEGLPGAPRAATESDARRYLLNSRTGVIHDTWYATEKCNLDALRRMVPAQRRCYYAEPPAGARVCRYCRKARERAEGEAGA